MIHPTSLHGLIDSAGGIVLTGGGVALTSTQLARFVVLLAEHIGSAPTQQRKPLTDAQLEAIAAASGWWSKTLTMRIARAVEAHHGITGDKA